MFVYSNSYVKFLLCCPVMSACGKRRKESLLLLTYMWVLICVKLTCLTSSFTFCEGHVAAVMNYNKKLVPAKKSMKGCQQYRGSKLGSFHCTCMHSQLHSWCCCWLKPVPHSLYVLSVLRVQTVRDARGPINRLPFESVQSCTLTFHFEDM